MMEGFSPYETDMESQIYSLIRYVIGSQIETVVPAEVTEPQDKTVQIKLQLKHKGAPDLVFNEVPVLYPFGLHMPLQKGDTGLLVTCKHDLSDWKAKDGKEAEIKYPIIFDLNSSWFVPMSLAKVSQETKQATLSYGNSKLQLNENGMLVTTKDDMYLATEHAKVALGDDGRVELRGEKLVNDQLAGLCESLLDLVDKLSDACKANPYTTHLTPIITAWKATTELPDAPWKTIVTSDVD